MTDNEAIEKLHAYLECESRKAKIVSCNKSCDDCELCYMQGTVREHITSVETAIQALEEVLQYRQIGTVEECLRNKDFLDFLSDKMNPNDFETYLSMYNSLGEKAGDDDGN